MGIATFPNTVSPIKSIQRGSAVAAGNITISAVDVNKTMVNSFSTGSAGTVAATGTVNAASGSTSGTSTSGASSSWNDGFGYAAVATAPQTWYSTYNLDQFQGGRYGQTYYFQYTYFEIPRRIVNANINAQNINAANVSLNSTNITGGTTSLTSAVYGAYLQDSTTLVVSGPCRYEIIEHY